MWYIVRLDSSRVTTLVKVRSWTRVSSSNPTRVKSNYIPVYTTIFTANRTLPKIECCVFQIECQRHSMKYAKFSHSIIEHFVYIFRCLCDDTCRIAWMDKLWRYPRWSINSDWNTRCGGYRYKRYFKYKICSTVKYNDELQDIVWFYDYVICVDLLYCIL